MSIELERLEIAVRHCARDRWYIHLSTLDLKLSDGWILWFNAQGINLEDGLAREHRLILDSKHRIKEEEKEDDEA